MTSEKELRQIAAAEVREAAARYTALWEDYPQLLEGEWERIVDMISEWPIPDPAPQIVRTPADLDALDGDEVLVHYTGVVRYACDTYPDVDLPAVVVASGDHVLACREALEGGNS